MPFVADNPPAVVRQLSAEELARQSLPKVGELLNSAAQQDFSSMSLSPLGVEGSTPLAADRTIYAKEQIEKQVSSASVFATRQMDTDGDQKITASELRKYAYVADQVGDRDGKLSVIEYNQLFSRGIQEYLLKTATEIGIPETTRKVLEGRFATGQFGLSGAQGLPDAIDIAQTSRSSLTTAEKTIRFSQLLEAATRKLPEEGKPKLMKAVLEHLAATGETLVPVENLGKGKLLLAGDSVEVSEGPKGSTVYRAKSELFEFQPSTGSLSSVEVQVAESAFTLINDEKYTHSSKDSNPFLDGMIERTLQTLENDPEITKAIVELKKATESTAPNPSELKRLLSPISNKLQNALGMSSSIGLEVKARNPESPQALAVYSHPQPGSGLPAKIEIFATPFLTQAAEETKRLMGAGLRREVALGQALGEFRQGVLSSLVEETFHAKQHSMIDTYSVNPRGISAEASSRVADYALNREFLVSPLDLKAYFGSTEAYENQPIEADAKKFRAAIVDHLLTRQ